MNHSANIDSAEVAKFDAMAAQWWEPNGPCAPLHILNPTRLLYIQKHVQLADRSVLDVGCGAGILTESLATLSAKVHGIDASADVIAAAKVHAESKNLSINYQACSIEEFTAQRNAQFDVITCMELIEHVPDPAQLIADCANLLKPGGHLFLSTLNRTPKSYLFAIIGAEYVLKLLPKQTHDYKKFIKPAELANTLRDANMQLRDLKGLKFDPFTKSAQLQDDLSVNYLAFASKEN
ncbi:MAG TPA: bifunctional 2-polyprenyl-6-hydroxyphenol methylase/3-demethylubiquinol 3-O-methyltransferase UbiG [Gammaproteobacteria bacterium]|nr:bifunctional 2-polyprenyl-6-hydroxyphenol methylase/3-demethylubiquinol 3-O-methyltransferase UbiG [Gammaproteobacteria bacterium]